MNMTSSTRRGRRSTPKGKVEPRRRRAFDMSGERAALLARNARRGDASSSSSPVSSAFGALFGAEAPASTRDADVERGDDARVVSTDATVFERGDDAEDDGGDEDDDGVMADGSVSDSRGRRRRGWPAWLALGTIALGGATARARDDQRRRTDGDGVAWRRGWARYRAVVVTTDRGGAERMVTPRGVVLRERRDDNRGFAAGRETRAGVAAVFQLYRSSRVRVVERG